MGLFSKNETGKPCQACGNATTQDDPAVRLKDTGTRVHQSHTTSPTSGLFGRPTKRR